MLSPKARAFSVDQLLSRRELQQTSKAAEDNRARGTTGNRRHSDELCQSHGDEAACRHQHISETEDDTGDLVKVELCQGDLWQAFHRLGTEMIITKTGRRMFPAVRVRVSGLKPNSKYKVAMDFIPVDKNKYRYVYHSSRWMVAGHGDTLKENQTYGHPESPMTGEYLTSQVMSFEKIKLTNNDTPSPGQVSLLSMQKFQPRIIIQEVKGTAKPITVTYPQTAFIAVTAYQNQEITRLKIARNPFAKGFREAGKCRSSLEAMMASFGVVIDSSGSQRASPVKRKLSENDSEGESISPPTKHPSTWSIPASVFDKRLPVALPMAVYPNFSNGFQSSINTNTSGNVTRHHHPPSPVKSSQTNSYMSSDVDTAKDQTINPLIDYNKLAVPTSVQNHQNGLQMCLPATDLHPAFRLYPHVQIPAIFDPGYINSYYKSLVPSNLHNVMVVSSNTIPAQLSDSRREETLLHVNEQLQYEKSGAVNLCTS